MTAPSSKSATAATAGNLLEDRADPITGGFGTGRGVLHADAAITNFE